jgi:predicted HicB family RNase H-like nuclease
MIEYKGYTGVFEFDASIDAFHGRVLGLQDVVTFEGRSVDELRGAMEESVEDYLDLCAEVGKQPERPYRGEFLVRTTPEVHRAAVTAAESEGMSLNAWVENAIVGIANQCRPDAVGRKPARKRSAAKGKSPATRRANQP